MRFTLASTLLFLKAQAVYSAGGDGYTYYEAGGLGPSNWAFLDLEGNQCGGTNGASGFGQSPVTVSEDTGIRCDTDMGMYDFEGGTCEWTDFDFSISNNGKKTSSMWELRQSSNCWL